MKRYFNYIWAVSFVLFALIMQSCSGDKAEVTNLIPKDSEIVLNLNMNNLYEKGQFKEFEKTKLYNQLTALLALTAPEIKTAFDDLVKDSDNTGLELKSEMYVFKTKANVGVIIPMKDKGKFEAYLKKISTGSNEQPRKIENYLAVGNGKDILAAWNDDVFFFLAGFEFSEASKVEDSFKAYIAQTKETSINANPYFATFSQNKKDISSLVNLESSFTSMNEVIGNGAAGYPMDIMNITKLMKGTNVGFFAEFNKGAVDYTTDYTLSEEMKKMVNVDKLMKKSMSDRLLKVMPKDFFLAYTASLEPKEFENYVQNMTKQTIESMQKSNANPSDIEPAKQLLEMYQQIASKLDGEMVFSILNMATGEDEVFNDTDESVPTFIAVAAAKSNTALEELTAGSVKKEGNYYVLLPQSPFGKIYAANANNMLMVSNNPEYLKNVEAGAIENNMTQSRFAKEMMNNGLYVAANLDVKYMPLSNDLLPLNLIRDKIDIFDYVDGKTVSPTRVQGALKFKDQNKNALKILMETIENIATGGLGM